MKTFYILYALTFVGTNEIVASIPLVVYENAQECDSMMNAINKEKSAYLVAECVKDWTLEKAK